MSSITKPVVVATAAVALAAVGVSLYFRQSKRSDNSLESRLAAVKSRYEAAGHGHVFEWVSQLSSAEVESLVSSAERIDLDYLNTKFKELSAANVEHKIEPFPPGASLDDIKDDSTPSSSLPSEWRARGLDQIRNGKVGVLLMAGGQGTRLGSSLPKGMYDIGLPSHKSLYQLMAEKIVRLQKIATNASSSSFSSSPSSSSTSSSPVRIPWYIMTSEATSEVTRVFLRDNNYFGLNKDDIFIFEQGLLPALDDNGKIIMQSASAISLAPNGNGGLYSALGSSGALNDMQKRGLSYIHIFGVDNVLVKVADPAMVGYALSTSADVVNKVILKSEPNERVGVMCLRGGKPGIVEYSELTKDQAHLRDAEHGQLVYSAANIANHLFTLPFLETCVKRANELPWHVARKKIPYAKTLLSTDACGSSEAKAAPLPITVTPEKENGIKMEMFVFDVFSFVDDPKKVVTIAAPRRKEFAPVKNANAPGTVDVSGAYVPNSTPTADSPLSARLAVFGLHTEWARSIGVDTSNWPDKAAMEISPLRAYDEYDLDDVANDLKSLTGPSHVQ